MRFGRRTAEARKEIGLSQSQLGEALGVTQTAVSGWEIGETEPGPRVVFRIEEALQVGPGELSRTLGYVPADLVLANERGVILVVQVKPHTGVTGWAIEYDPDLNEFGRELVRGVYLMVRRVLRNQRP